MERFSIDAEQPSPCEAESGYGPWTPHLEVPAVSSRDLSAEDAAVDTVVLDVDGTLVDSVYQHVRAWDEAFRRVGVDVSAWRLHRAIGMGGDRIVAALAGRAVEVGLGDEIRRHHDERYADLVRDVRPLPGAAELLSALRLRGHLVVLASSGSREQTAEAVERIGAAAHIHAWISGKDVVGTKPAPDSLDLAIDRVGGRRAAVVGDSVWDMEPARARGHVAIGLLSGGFGAAELRAAGADLVFEDPADLLEHLDETPLRRAREEFRREDQRS
jgi:phosphoglycolate phosphatase-like HAD superfamily hydrolase